MDEMEGEDEVSSPVGSRPGSGVLPGAPLEDEEECEDEGGEGEPEEGGEEEPKEEEEGDGEEEEDKPEEEGEEDPAEGGDEPPKDEGAA